jgi:hypothetical protein
MKKNINGRIAILGWGSLIWEPRPDFEKYIEDWSDDGPILPIEFSRVSSTRDGALTLVIDPDNGAPVRVKFALSKRKNPEDAACDLRTREGTIIRHIGLFDREISSCRSHWSFVEDKIRLWAEDNNLRAVVWTDLPSNYTEKTGKIFEPNEAVRYLKGLNKEGQKAAKEYIQNAPLNVNTNFRAIVANDEWMK